MTVDWNSLWTKCKAGHDYHPSDGGCPTCEAIEEAAEVELDLQNQQKRAIRGGKRRR